MVYDCFTFFNELDLLEIRLNVLKDVADKFVLVESGETHTGKPKPFYFADNKSRFAEFVDRILYVRIDKFPAGHDAWWNENYQRNMIASALDEAKDTDKVMISDLDEIPNPQMVKSILDKTGVWSFHHVSYGFYLNMRDLRCRNMHGTKLLSVRDFKSGFDGVEISYDEFLPSDVNQGTTATKIRRRGFPVSRGGEHEIKNAGWHFTCLGGAEKMLEKMRSVAPHRGFDSDDEKLTRESVAQSIANGRGIGLKMNCFAVPIDETFPEYIRENQNRYRHLIFGVTPEYRRRNWLPRTFRMTQGRLIQFAEWAIPSRLHYFLHIVRKWMAQRTH